MALSRGGGILLHPTSLPGPHGSGDLGAEAHRFLDWLAATRQRYWQMLPLSPVGYGSSPYSSLSAFAGNPMLIDVSALVDRGWLASSQMPAATDLPDGRLDFGRSGGLRTPLLRRAADAFFAHADPTDRAAYQRFCEKQAAWLEDFALFMALNETHDGAEWTSWEKPLAHRESAALERARESHAGAVRRHRFAQWVFFEQWSRLREAARAKGIRLIGDAPIFVAFHSADVWAHQELFFLDEARRPTVVAGVPPDYFSATGQRWGNPLYRWDKLAQTGFAWWVDRLRALLDLVDVVRLDHFRGFAGYWEIPAAEKTAVRGRWAAGPGEALFLALARELGPLPIVAEDLGVITPDVTALRDRFRFPGMKVLQFAFGSDATNPFLPHNFERNAVVYTGTHDNDTTRGWFDEAPEAERDFARRYLATDGHDIAWDFIRLAYQSVADVAVVPFQDVLGLGSEARMNRPGLARGNWDWRFSWAEVPESAAARLEELARLYGRAPKTDPADE